MAVLEWGSVELNNIINFAVEEVLVNAPIMLLDGSVYLWKSDKVHRRIRVEGVSHGLSDINTIRNHLGEENYLYIGSQSYGRSIITGFSWNVWKHKGWDIWYKYTIEFTTKE